MDTTNGGDAVVAMILMALWFTTAAMAIFGIVQWFRGGRTGMGIASLFVPFLCFFGIWSQPKPGSARYMTLPDAKRQAADRRWPIDAQAFHSLYRDGYQREN